MGETILQIPIPYNTELCCLLAKIDSKETQDSSAKSEFHWKTFKCRLILDAMRDSVIACPVYQTVGFIHIITSVEFFKSQLLQENLSKMNLTWSSPRPVTPDVYANCLRYSILFAIAPKWNRVGQYLIAGKYFVMNTAQTNLEIKAIIKVQPLKIKQCCVSLEDFDIPHEVISHFMADVDGRIDVNVFGNYRVTVLPSLKKGKLMEVLKKIPASSPFKNYGELRRHWKNMYGYRLPESDIGIIYYDVYFSVPNAHRFLYPHVCVRTRLIETPYLGNHEAQVQSFLEDISEAVPTICGQTFKIIEKSENFEKSTIRSSNYCQENKDPEKINAAGRDTPTFLKTPERKVNAEFAPKNLDETTRLSLSPRITPKNCQPFRRDLSSLMSPTPSQRGNFRRGEMASSKLRGILTTAIRDPKSAALRFPRSMKTDNHLPDSQNCCPNVAEIEQRKVQDDKSAIMEFDYARDKLLPRIINNHLPDSQNSCPNSAELDQRKVQEDKSALMEIENSRDKLLPPIFMPLSSFDLSSQSINEMSPIFSPLKCEQDSLSATEMKYTSQVSSKEVVSKYFETQSGSSGQTNHSRIEDNEASQTSRKISLMQKLRNNMKPRSENENQELEG